MSAPVDLSILAGVLREYDRNTCTHEETHRGGAIWTICDGCGMKWADDRGGFEPYQEPESIAAARALLAGASPACADPVVETNVALLRSRSAVGIAKYGTTVAGNNLPLRAWLNHALEETLDNANYLQRAMQEIDAAPAPATPAASVDAAITEEMLNAARDWSVKKYGIGIGNDAAIGCWTAMAAAAPQQHAQAALSDFEDAKGRRWRFGLRAEDAKCDLNPYGRNIVAQAMLDKGDSVSVDTSTGLHYFKSATEIVLRPIFPASQQPAAAPAPVKQANAGPSMGDMPSDRLIKSLPLTVFAPSPVQREVKS